MSKFIVALLFPVFLLTGCFTNEAGKVSKSKMGAIGGGIAGALVGSAVGGGSGKSIAIAAGAIVGSMAGSELGKSLDRRDLELQQKIQVSALEYNKSGNASTWKNPDTNASGYVKPTNTFINSDGQNCREYTQEIKIGDKAERGFGTACRRSDGSWEIVK